MCQTIERQREQATACGRIEQYARAYHGRVLLGGGSHRLMRPQEGAHPVDGAGQQLGRLAPRKDRDLGVRRQRGDIDRGPERVCRRVDGQHEDRRAAVADEIARHAVQEIGPRAL